MALSDRSIAVTSLVIGIVLGIVGILSGYYFYQLSLRERLPSFSVDPVRTTIVNAGDFSDLEVLYNGNPVKQKSVISVRIYFWNRGELPIIKASHDLLRPIQFVLPEGTEILDKRILKVSRNEVGFVASISQTNRNILDIDFTILEKNDGASIQIIYAGSAQAEMKVVGSIVGTDKIESLKTYANPNEMPLLLKLQTQSILIRAAFSLGIIGIVYAVGGIFLSRKYPRFLS